MVSKGFYYFDKVFLNNYDDCKYYLKARPRIPLLLNGSDDKLENILPRTKIDQDLNYLNEFFADEVA